MSADLHFLDHPRAEVVFGIVSAIGTNLDVVRAHLKDRLDSLRYVLEVQRLSKFFGQLQHGVTLAFDNEYDRVRTHMKAGDEVRRQSGRPDFAALYAINEIGRSRESPGTVERRPKPSAASLLWSLKRPEEVTTLRKVYREGFFLIGVFAPRKARKDYLHSKGMNLERAEDLIRLDELEEEGPENPFGQQTGRTFHLADVFVDITAPTLKDDLDRFVNLVFGHPFVTPRLHEYAMFLAHAASLRSADLSRQVGAVVLSQHDEIVAVGANDVPAPGGGLYWPGDGDQRDYVRGHDSNEVEREAMLVDVLDRLKPVLKAGTTTEEARALLSKCRVLDITEFGRAVHAEMEAILSAGRSGVSLLGGTLYATTFPCHNCAKHIVGAGIEKVFYIEPYPKSLAADLYDDTIALEHNAEGKAEFEPFVGIGPRRFFDLFSLSMSTGRVLTRKARGGQGRKAEWTEVSAQARLPLSPLSYLEREESAAALLEEVMAGIGAKKT